MQVLNNILEAIGNTPLIRINKIAHDVPAQVFVKLETVNPGHSIKDRMAIKMVEDAEANGYLKPGGTIIECTSGNTGMGLAIAGCVKGYKCIFTTNDKQSREKMDMLKAMGAEVIICPTNVTPDDPRSYYSVAERLSKEIENSYWFNQYDNLSNRQAHYESTGPEIWKQTAGKITHFIVGVGTGGTISGTGKYLKEQNPDIQIIGIDTYGSVFKKYHETGVFDEEEIYPYITEGIGEDILPKNVDFSVIDHFEKVTDKDGALMARRLAREEGLFFGYSGGSAFAGLRQMKNLFKKDDVVVVAIHDHGSRYVGKIYNDDWMRDHGFLSKEPQIKDLIQAKHSKAFITVSPNTPLPEVLQEMKKADISQLPVMDNGRMVGAISEIIILNAMLERGLHENPGIVQDFMQKPFPEVPLHATWKEAVKLLDSQNQALICKDLSGQHHIITQYDLVQSA